MMSNFGTNLSKLMKDRGVSPKALSIATGVPTSTISEWSAGRDPRVGRNVIRVAQFFNVSLEFLITGEHAEQEALEEILKGGGETFVTLHRGVYRFTIEKATTKNEKRGAT